MTLTERLVPARLIARSAARGTHAAAVVADELVVERMRRRDLRAVLAIEEQVYPRPWTPTTFQTELAEMKAGHREYIVVRRLGTIVGYAGLMLMLDEAHVANVAVDPNHRRRGVARRLMLELCLLARAHGTVALSLEVRVSNTGAQALYEEFGFASEGVRRRYYENVEDAIIMWRRNVDSVEFGSWLNELAGRMKVTPAVGAPNAKSEEPS